ncbi:MAG: lysozyme [Alphaproteobacteria bacterium]
MRSPIDIALDEIRRHEGCHLQAYPDPASPKGKLILARRRGRNVAQAEIDAASGDPWTVGWGCTGPEIVEGTAWTQEQADAELLARVEELDRQIVGELEVETTTNQRAALIILAYNIGIGRHADRRRGIKGLGLRGSTLLRLLNAGDVAGAADQFLVWNKAGGLVMAGLVTRREAERALFLTPDG